LYNEKAYVLSRGFVRHALEIPVDGLESEINWMYYTNKRLEKIVLDVRVLIENSKASSDQSDAGSELAVPRLSIGGRITLDRTLSKLHGLLDKHRNALVSAS
jgi:ubiquitin-conjugating enzyme E2 O